MLRKLLGLAPTLEEDGSYSPSKLALKLGTVKKTDYDHSTYQKYRGRRPKVLVVCTEQKDMRMRNGKRFSTGNHPVEALVPLLHLREAGFEFEIVTPTGQAAAFEMWAFPNEDAAVKGIFESYRPQFEQPGCLEDVAERLADGPSDGHPYAAIFIPGGHGAMLGLPEDPNMGKLLAWANEQQIFIITLCHGPGSLLTTALDGGPFPYEDYQMAVFPDSVDQMTPMLGYLPGHMPFGLSERLKALGVKVINKKGDDTVVRDRHLLTGASPLASNKLGKLAAATLLAELD